MPDVARFALQVSERVPGYQRFLHTQDASAAQPFAQLPLTTKQNYLLEYPIEQLCWDGAIGNCHLIGSSSGFSKSGSVFWPKRPEDEIRYLESVESMLVEHYGIDQERTLILCCMALGTWFGGMAVTAALRVIAASGRLPITVCTPGLNLAEAVEIYARFHPNFTQTLWITNPSNIGLISALLAKRGITPPPGSCSFPVLGEYFSEAGREAIARRYGHPADAPFVLWTGYGSADTGDIAVETAATIRLRKFFHHRPDLGRELFGSDDTPMLLELSPKVHLELVDGMIVVTKDQLVPLVRYNTGDLGGLLTKADLARRDLLPPELLHELPEQVLFVRGRAANAVIFYGTNLDVQEINRFFLDLPPEMAYSGLFTVKVVDEAEVNCFDFTVQVHGGASDDLARRYREALLAYLIGRSREFEMKYTSLTRSAGRELIRLRVQELDSTVGAVKHRYILD